MKKSIYNIEEIKDNELLIFNTFSKSVALFVGDVKEKYLNDQINDIDESILKEMKQQGFVVDNSVDEYNIIKEKYLEIINSNNILYITIIGTYGCNFRCPYCFEGSEVKNNFSIIDFSVLEKFAKNNFKNYKMVHVTWFGGEPLLLIKQMNQFSKVVKSLQEEYNFKYTSGIATNGYLMKKDIFDDLVHNCNVYSYQVTIDGYKNSHNKTRKLVNGDGTYDVIINNFKEFIHYIKNEDVKIYLTLRVNLLNNKLNEVKELLDSFTEEEKQYFEIYFRNVYNTSEFNISNENRDNLEDFYKLAKDNHFNINFGNFVKFYHCEGAGGKSQIQILPDLSVWKCINNPEYKDACIGKVLENGDLQLDESKIQKWISKNVYDDEKCKDCKYLPLCWGGCPLLLNIKGTRNCIYEKQFKSISSLFKM